MCLIPVKDVSNSQCKCIIVKSAYGAFECVDKEPRLRDLAGDFAIAEGTFVLEREKSFLLDLSAR